MFKINLISKKGLRQLAKKTLTMSLACILAFTPSIASTAKEQDTKTLETTQENETTTENYTETKKIAKKAANSLVMQYNCSSVQYALIHNGEIVLSDSAGSANIAKRKAPTKDTMYGIGSISKVFTTVAIMQLVEKGVIELDKPVVNYIPEFKMADERYKKITVRMLINHSSGLMGNLIGNTLLFYDPDSVNTDNFLNLLSKQRLKADPGSYSVYSNDGFTLAEILIQKVTGSTYTNYIEENICKPLNLSNTKSPQSGFPKSKMAKSYINKLELPIEYPNFIGAGGLYSTAEDLCHFLELFMKDTSVLSKKSIEAMAQPEYKKGLWGNDGDNILNYGLGWDCINLYPFNRYNIQAFEKGGDTTNYHGCVTMLPDSEYGVAVLTSGGSSSYCQVLGNTILLNALKEQNIIPEILPDKTGDKLVKVTMPDYYKDYAGYYVNNALLFKIEFTDKNSLKLYADPESKEGTELFYAGNGFFKDETGVLEFTFKDLSNGKSYINLKTYTSFPGIGSTLADVLFAQKLDENKVSAAAQASWNARAGKSYYVVNEKYSSVSFTSIALFTINKTNPVDGYINNCAIVDSNHLECRVQIPMNSGRDLMDYSIFTDKGVEYIRANSYVCIEEDAIKNLSNEKKFDVTIDSDGYSKWFNIPNKGKQIKVTIPKNAAFAIYDKDGNLTFLSTIHKNKVIKLPKGGKIMFAGDASATFTVNYK